MHQGLMSSKIKHLFEAFFQKDRHHAISYNANAIKLENKKDRLKSALPSQAGGSTKKIKKRYSKKPVCSAYTLFY